MSKGIIQRWIATLLLASAWCVVPGCGSGRPQTTRVTGTVTYQGKPVEQANVMFACKTGRPAEAITDAAGRFILTTFREGDGAIGGDHTVVISKYVSVSNAAGKSAISAPATTIVDLRNPQTPPPRQAIPARYTSPSESPLRVTVTVGGDNDFTFKLTD